MLRILAVLAGLGFIFVGVAGYLPAFMQDNLLFGYFEVDSMHNVVHIVTGIIAIIAATSAGASRLFFQVFGILYAIVAIIGFWRGGDLFIMHMNMADNILHIVIAIVALLFGFALRRA